MFERVLDRLAYLNECLDGDTYELVKAAYRYDIPLLQENGDIVSIDTLKAALGDLTDKELKELEVELNAINC